MSVKKHTAVDILPNELKYYFKYYSDYINNLQKHIDILYRYWIIDTNERNKLISQLESIFRLMINIYNKKSQKSSPALIKCCQHNKKTHNNSPKPP